MIPRIAKFEKVTYPRFCNDCLVHQRDPLLEREFSALSLPLRATAGSAGYDFFSPFTFSLEPGQGITIPSGIRCSIAPGWALFMLPKSGLGFKFRLQLDNTIGLVDAKRYLS